MDISKLWLDTQALDSGVWIDNIPDQPGARFRVRGLSSSIYQDARDAKMRAVPDAGRDADGNVTRDEVKRIARECCAEALLLEWDGLENKGEPLPYSKALADQILSNPDAIRFADVVTWCATEADRRNTGTKDILAKNSVPPSSGS